ncbi:MAG: thiamine phosphate synthase [Alphaproteobacteria bacterium]
MRSYEMESTRREALGRALRIVCRQRGLFFLVARDFRLAARTGADGLHLPEGLARHGILSPTRLWLRWSGRLLTVAAHSPGAIRRARTLGATAVLLSPVFPTTSHPGARTIGVTRFAAWHRQAGMPVYALGGMNARSARRLGHHRIAGISLRGYGEAMPPPCPHRGRINPTPRHPNVVQACGGRP